jgi:hypothetical protein
VKRCSGAPFCLGFVNNHFPVNIVDFQPPPLAVGFATVASSVVAAPPAVDSCSQFFQIAAVIGASSVSEYVCFHRGNVANEAGFVLVNPYAFKARFFYQ